jgi:spermidine synthase
MISIKHYLNPQLIKTFTSEYNSEIQLIKFMGKYRLDMGGLTQSGPIIEDIWHSSLKKLLPKNFSPEKILILGFCSGSAARVIQKLYPKSLLTGIEIDPVVIDIAKKYFEIEKIPNLSLINTNAIEYVKQLSKTDNFDLILIDCYVGHQIPLQLEDVEFLSQIKNHTNHLLLNRLFWDEHKNKTLKFLEKIKNKFSLTSHRTTWNLVISLSS